MYVTTLPPDHVLVLLLLCCSHVLTACVGVREQKADFGSKMSFFITKADQVPRALDRQTIITQTVAVRDNLYVRAACRGLQS